VEFIEDKVVYLRHRISQVEKVELAATERKSKRIRFGERGKRIAVISEKGFESPASNPLC